MALRSDGEAGWGARLLVLGCDLSQEVGGHEAPLTRLPQLPRVETVLVHLTIDVDEIAAAAIQNNNTLMSVTRTARCLNTSVSNNEHRLWISSYFISLLSCSSLC